jgi:hypothetical protein
MEQTGGKSRQQKWCCAMGGECMEQTGRKETESKKCRKK